MATAGPLQYVPFSSALDAGFWHKLSQQKLDVYGLNDEQKALLGCYTNGCAPGIPCNLNLDYTAFDSDKSPPPLQFPSHGNLKLVNTMEEFKDCDKVQLQQQQGMQVWQDIVSGRAIENPALLSNFLLLVHADLKKYVYTYWFSFPAFSAPDNVTRGPVAGLRTRFSAQQVNSLVDQYTKVCREPQVGYFLLQELNGDVVVAPLNQFPSLRQKGPVMLGVCDPSNLDSNPGWPLRNLLTLASYHWASDAQDFEVICLRDRTQNGQRSVDHSIVFTVHLTNLSALTGPKCVGWEKNKNGKLGPRRLDLSATMNPAKLAESAVDLNLKLMRWRLLPELDLDTISQTKCLLLGAGTLGCNVARCLLGWGVRNITLLDNGTVSYSNPVRQTLFTFADSNGGGRPKAETAAASLQEIFPGVNARGISLSIPMPGHSVTQGDLESVKRASEQLDALVREHDAVFLLMDTRESRWLPTLLAAHHRKLVITAALGFDTYLVLRHGVKLPADAMETEPAGDACSSSFRNIIGNALGCYFCNDVVAPGDSTRNRTLDQQCTVSRPGMSFITSALAVELLVSVLQHPDRGNAMADTVDKDDQPTSETASALGMVPHQIRGYLSRFHHILPATRAFDKCTACCQTVIREYETHGFDFLLKVFNEANYLEDLTGLSQLHAETYDAEVWELSDDSDM